MGSIQGLSINCRIGPLEVLRAPYLELAYKRRAALTRCRIDIPDPEGRAGGVLAPGQDMRVRFGYRGSGFWHEWQGRVTDIEGAGPENPDAIRVRGYGEEAALVETRVRESFYQETARAVARRLLARTGLPLGQIDIPGDVLPHQVFSDVSVARAIKQLAQTLEGAFGHDLSAHAVWLGAGGLNWSAADEPGAAYVIETAKNLIRHAPPARPGEMGGVVSALLPGLTDGRRVRIRDTRRGINTLERAEEVIHALEATGNTTTVLYGKQAGWG
jgi:hypothetical protein